MFRNYVKLSLKVFARRKFFTFVSLFGISFTLTVLMLATALLDHVLAPAPPESRQSRMLVNHSAMMFSHNGGNRWSSPAGFMLFDRYARDLPGVERLSIYATGASVASFLDGQKVVSELKRTDGQYWQILDFTFIEGGPYTDADVEAARAVAVINETTRRRFFGGQPAVGRTLEADGQRFTVVGVAEDVSSLREASSGDIWAPLTTAKSDAYRREVMGDHHALVLARDASWLPRIREEFNERLTRVELPDARNYDTIVAPLESKLDSIARQSPFVDRGNPERQGWKVLVALAAGALLFALLPTVNLINLNVSRILERASEIGVRKAFGASSRALVWQFVVENVILTLGGGALGLVLAGALLRAFNASGTFAYADLTLNFRIFLYGLCLALAFGVLSGVYPAWRMSRLHPAEALKGRAR
jgi:putative ABC transport system permease protein